MAKKSVIFLGISLLLGGCESIDQNRPTPFPSEPQMSVYAEGEPLIICNEDDTFTIPYKMIDNCMKEHAYLKIIKEWKKKNKIQ